MEFLRHEPIRSPRIKVEVIKPFEIAGVTIKGFDITDMETGKNIRVCDNLGKSDEPYQVVACSLSVAEGGKLFFDLANQNPENPRDIYVDLNGVVFRFNPREKVPVQIYGFSQKSSEDIATELQRGILENIKPGLSNVLFDDN